MIITAISRISEATQERQTTTATGTDAKQITRTISNTTEPNTSAAMAAASATDKPAQQTSRLAQQVLLRNIQFPVLIV